MKHYDDYSAEELKTMLQRYFLYADLDDAAVDEMEAILAALRKKAPFPHTHTTAEMWAEFQAEHAEELASLGIQNDEDTKEVVEKEAADTDAVRLVSGTVAVHTPRRRRLLRVGLIAALMVVVILAAAATASAMGINLFGWVPVWNNHVMSYGEEETKPNELNDSSPIAVTLAQLGINEPLYPHYLPDGFNLKTSIIETDPVFLHESYFNRELCFSITIQPSSFAETFLFQKDGFPLHEYTKKGVIHYIVSDDNQVTATWQAGDYSVYIVGSISIEDMERVIDSVYEVMS